MRDRRTRPDWLAIGQWPARDGWPLRSFRVEAAKDVPLRGSLIFQTGRADFLEKYTESFDHWRRRGWSIEGFDWRGQGGSGRVLDNARIGHGAPYANMLDDLDGYVGDWRVRTPGPHFLIGHSMGGHLVLRLLAEASPQVDGAVLIAPMLGLNTRPITEWLANMIARIACRIGLAEHPAWHEAGDSGSGHRQSNLTHSAERYADELWWRTHDAMLDIGAPSWNWLVESWASIARLRVPGVLESVATPLLILYAERDRLISAEAIRRAARRLPNARLLGDRTSAHELLRENDRIRLWALAAIDDFIEGTS